MQNSSSDQDISSVIYSGLMTLLKANNLKHFDSIVDAYFTLIRLGLNERAYEHSKDTFVKLPLIYHELYKFHNRDYNSKELYIKYSRLLPKRLMDISYYFIKGDSLYSNRKLDFELFEKYVKLRYSILCEFGYYMLGNKDFHSLNILIALINELPPNKDYGLESEKRRIENLKSKPNDIHKQIQKIEEKLKATRTEIDNHIVSLKIIKYWILYNWISGSAVLKVNDDQLLEELQLDIKNIINSIDQSSTYPEDYLRIAIDVWEKDDWYFIGNWNYGSWRNIGNSFVHFPELRKWYLQGYALDLLRHEASFINYQLIKELLPYSYKSFLQDLKQALNGIVQNYNAINKVIDIGDNGLLNQEKDKIFNDIKQFELVDNLESLKKIHETQLDEDYITEFKNNVLTKFFYSSSLFFLFNSLDVTIHKNNEVTNSLLYQVSGIDLRSAFIQGENRKNIYGLEQTGNDASFRLDSTLRNQLSNKERINITLEDLKEYLYTTIKNHRQTDLLIVPSTNYGIIEWLRDLSGFVEDDNTNYFLGEYMGLKVYRMNELNQFELILGESRSLLDVSAPERVNTLKDAFDVNVRPITPKEIYDHLKRGKKLNSEEDSIISKYKYQNSIIISFYYSLAYKISDDVRILKLER